MKYVLLSEDLSQAMASYEPLNDAEVAWYRAIRRNGGFTPVLFSDEAKHAMRLLAADGWDESPVGSRNAEQTRRFWDYEHEHEFPPTRDLVRFGIFMHWPLLRILALTLKGQWEEQLASSAGYPSGHDHSLRETLSNIAFLEEHRRGFQPDHALIYERLEEHHNIASSVGHNEQNIADVIRELVLNRLHLLANESRELAAFMVHIEAERLQVNDGTTDEQSTFWTLKAERFALYEQLGGHLLELDNQKLENEQVRVRWLAVFGDAFLPLEQQYLRLTLLAKQLDLKTILPHLSREELEREARVRLIHGQERLSRLERDIALASHARLPASGGVVDERELGIQRDQNKRILRKIWLLLHPDILQQNPSYAKLTDDQKQFLVHLQRQLTQFQPSELGFDPSQVGFDHKSGEYLQAKLEQVQRTLNNAGVDLNVELEVRGETLAAKLAWLRADIERLKRGIQEAEEALLEALSDADVRERRCQLGCPEQFQAIKKTICERAEQYRREADELEGTLAALFEE